MQAAALVPFYTTQAQQLLFWGERGLAASPTHSRPARFSAPGQPGAHAGPPCSHRTSHPCSRRAPSALPLPWQPPAPRVGPRHRQRWHHAGCTAARDFAGSRGKSQARAAVETWQEGWTGAAEGERALAPTLGPLQLGGAPTGGGALSYSPSQSRLLFTRTSQHLFPLSV